MARGRPKKKIEVEKHEEIKEKEMPEIEAKPVVSPVVEKVEEKLEPLQPGQKYFEAPSGEIVVGEDTKSQIWFRKLNNGRGGWINPKR